jgi:hypothetical protein
MPQHPGTEPRPEGPYFGSRGHLVSQGDIFEDAPVLLKAGRPGDEIDMTSAEVMVLTASCFIDHRAEELLICPVVVLDELGLNEGVVTEMRQYDCHHRLLYLPAEGDRPERAGLLHKAQAIDRHVLEACDRQSQLTAEATRHLMRKLTLFFTGNHFPRATFVLAPDDFPAPEPG